MRYYVSDFETVCYTYEQFKDKIKLSNGQSKEAALIDYLKYNDIRTYVWSAAYCEVGNDDPSQVGIVGSIEKWFEWVDTLKTTSTIYFHNLSFDGSFIIDYLLRNGYNHCFDKNIGKKDDKNFKCLITDLGRWFSIGFKNKHNVMIHIWNSLNILPFSLKKIGEGFKTKHQKTSMDYTNKTNLKQCSKSDIEYIKNDVLILSEGLDIIINQKKLCKMTIGTNCLNEYKELLKQDLIKIDSKYKDYKIDKIFRLFFKDLTKFKLSDSYEAFDADDYIRQSYKGGWCYVNQLHYQNFKMYMDDNQIIHKKGCVYDYNSMHPSMMLKYAFPIGKPTFWTGNFIPQEANDDKHLFFIRLKCKFELKERHFPSIQIKHNPKYPSNEWLKTSKSYQKTRVIDEPVELTLTQVDYELMLDNYNLSDLTIIDGCYFEAAKGLFDSYIYKWAEIKQNSKGAIRMLAKLFLNNLYGKFGTSRISICKEVYIDEDGYVKFKLRQEQHEKDTVNVAVAAFITAYSRYTVIKAAEANYDTFAYSDTDSIHILSEYVNDIELDDNRLCFWKLEDKFIKSKYIRQKTYMEYMVKDYGEGWTVKCAGLTQESINLLNNVYNTNELKQKGYKQIIHNIESEFKVGLNIEGKLMPKRVNGGIILVNTEFTLKNKNN